MEFLEKHLTRDILTVTYQDGDRIMHLMLSLPEALDLLWRTDTIQGHDTATTFLTSLVLIAFVTRPQGPEEEPKEQRYMVPLTDVLRDLTDAEWLRVIHHHEMQKQYNRLGYRRMVDLYSRQLKELNAAVAANREALKNAQI